MSIALAILFSVVISLGISIYFHSLQKNSDPMNKVKKYADKRQEDLQNLYKSIKNDFTHLASEFDARQTQANAAIKLLNQ